MKLSLEENNKNYKFFLSVIAKEGLIDRNREYSYWANFPVDVKELECLYNFYVPGMSFIDLGCGAGQVLRYARHIGYKTKGIEFDKKFETVLTNFDVDFINLKEMDLRQLEMYDVVYCYKPFKKGLDDFLKQVKTL